MEHAGRCLPDYLDARSNLPRPRTSSTVEPVLVLSHNQDSCSVRGVAIDHPPFLTASHRAVITSKTDDDRSDDEDDGEGDNDKED